MKITISNSINRLHIGFKNQIKWAFSVNQQFIYILDKLEVFRSPFVYIELSGMKIYTIQTDNPFLVVISK